MSDEPNPLTWEDVAVMESAVLVLETMACSAQTQTTEYLVRMTATGLEEVVERCYGTEVEA